MEELKEPLWGGVQLHISLSKGELVLVQALVQVQVPAQAQSL